MEYAGLETWRIETRYISDDGKVAKREVPFLHLKKPVLIEGADYWGRRAWINFHPTEERGWFWKFGRDHRKIRIYSRSSAL